MVLYIFESDSLPDFKIGIILDSLNFDGYLPLCTEVFNICATGLLIKCFVHLRNKTWRKYKPYRLVIRCHCFFAFNVLFCNTCKLKKIFVGQYAQDNV